MSELYQSLSHSQWDCQYQVVLGAQTAAKVDFRAGTPATGCDRPRAGWAKGMPDYGGTSDARPCACGLAIPPKHPEASVIGFLRGKSAMAIARRSGKERNFTGEHFWARGYAVSSVGFELEQVRQYHREQEAADGHNESF